MLNLISTVNLGAANPAIQSLIVRGRLVGKREPLSQTKDPLERDRVNLKQSRFNGKLRP
jgi:hypothetical protein